MTSTTSLTKAQLLNSLALLNEEMAHIRARTGCPADFMPAYKLSDHLGVSVSLIKFATKEEGIKLRTYSTATGGHIINCKGYPITTVKNAVGRVIQNSRKVTKTLVRHEPSKRLFEAGKMSKFVGQKLK